LFDDGRAPANSGVVLMKLTQSFPARLRTGEAVEKKQARGMVLKRADNLKDACSVYRENAREMLALYQSFEPQASSRNQTMMRTKLR